MGNYSVTLTEESKAYIGEIVSAQYLDESQCKKVGSGF